MCVIMASVIIMLKCCLSRSITCTLVVKARGRDDRSANKILVCRCLSIFVFSLGRL